MVKWRWATKGHGNDAKVACTAVLCGSEEESAASSAIDWRSPTDRRALLEGYANSLALMVAWHPSWALLAHSPCHVRAGWQTARSSASRRYCHRHIPPCLRLSLDDICQASKGVARYPHTNPSLDDRSACCASIAPLNNTLPRTVVFFVCLLPAAALRPRLSLARLRPRRHDY